MPDFRICVQIRDPREGVTTEWIDLQKYDAIGIEILLREMGYDDYDLEIDATNGFFGFMPESIDEACALFADYQKLDDPQSWQLYLEWYAEPLLKLPKTVPNFEKTFLGLYESPGDYMKEEALDNNEIRLSSAVMPYVNWEEYANKEEIAGKILFITDPLSRKTAVFETRL